MIPFSHREFSDALALVNSAALLWDRAGVLGRPVLDLLARLVPGHVAGYSEREIGSHRLLTACRTSDRAPPPAVVRAAARYCDEYPLSIQHRSRERRALKISDFTTSAELHRLDYYQHALRPMGIEHQMRLWLPAPPGVARYLYVNRGPGERDFDERDRELLELLRPFLVASRHRADSGPARRVDGLTARENEILAWVARGRTNREVAAVLLLSPNTVRKHLENVFEKLDVHTRAAAVARWLAESGDFAAD